MNRLIRLPDHCLRLCSIKMTVAVLSVYPVNKKYSIHILFNKNSLQWNLLTNDVAKM